MPRKLYVFAILHFCRLDVILTLRGVKTQELLQNAAATAGPLDAADSTKEALQALVSLQSQASPSGFQSEEETEKPA